MQACSGGGSGGSGRALLRKDCGVGASEKLDGDLLAEAIDAHLEEAEELGACGSLEAADAWSVGAIAFLLLCGYPPFFAPCRYAILARIAKTDFAFDPPFWSKISEEAKDFVQRCLRANPCRRLSVAEALQHPWIQSLADTSPSGSMLSSFALNLRRFYRTSLIEAFAANSLAGKLSFGDLHDLYIRCCEGDSGRSGFLTATDLRQILMSLGHSEIAEAIGMCFSRTLRHPGESYIDYSALTDSALARRERQLEEELWRCFRAFNGDSGHEELSVQAGMDSIGRLPLARVHGFLQVQEVKQLLLHDGIEDCAAVADAVQPASDQDALGALAEVDFEDIVAEVSRHLPLAGAAAVECAQR